MNSGLVGWSVQYMLLKTVDWQCCINLIAKDLKIGYKMSNIAIFPYTIKHLFHGMNIAGSFTYCFLGVPFSILSF